MADKEHAKVNADPERAHMAMCELPVFAPTPIEFFGNVGGAELYVKRDDLIPVALGGNKVRIAAECFAEMSRRGCDAVITYGSLTSNLNRAVALMAKEAGVKCYAIVKVENVPGSGKDSSENHNDPCPANSGSSSQENGIDSAENAARKLPMNFRLVLASGAEVVETDGAHVRETVAKVLAVSRARGEKPFYIYGDETGHGNEEVLARAYKKVYGEILRQERELFDGEYHFTEIFTAVGTGSTINGLIAAVAEENAAAGLSAGMAAGGAGDHHITGISVARSKEAVLRATGPEDEHFTITDEYMAGGYAKAAAAGTAAAMTASTADQAAGKEQPTAALENFCKETALAHAMPLDPVYTGKALFGTMEEIKKRDTTGKVLFLHTGGTPLYYDMLQER